jgi:hypothetical protein
MTTIMAIHTITGTARDMVTRTLMAIAMLMRPTHSGLPLQLQPR